MTTPYIKQLKIKDCFAVKDLNIPQEPLNSFKHIIITGKNGSGKTTILDIVGQIVENIRATGTTIESTLQSLANSIQMSRQNPSIPQFKKWTCK